MNILEGFRALFNPSETLGAFLISIFATFVGGFLFGRATNSIKARNTNGDIIQGSKVNKK